MKTSMPLRLAIAGLCLLLSGCGGDDAATPAAEQADESPTDMQTTDDGASTQKALLGPSLLDDAEPGATFTVSGVGFDYSELADLAGAAPVDAKYGAVISPVLAETLEGDLELYQRQVQHVVNELRNASGPRRVHLLGAVYRELPRLDGGVSIVATVLIDNQSSETATNLVIDADLRNAAGGTVADGRFVLEQSRYGELPSETMMLANLIFPPARVLDSQAELVDGPVLQAQVEWEVLRDAE